MLRIGRVIWHDDPEACPAVEGGDFYLGVYEINPETHSEAVLVVAKRPDDDPVCPGWLMAEPRWGTTEPVPMPPPRLWARFPKVPA